ncbi:hypothetical protein NBE98_07690 [Clostridium swellfunianum]|uniref:hypothetical protein n=1 Tax=Clostridium swellfunianum TaxID=1367462 RepID=UPI00202E5DFF|nr:hypothetical protein [Clostridium swellfunianum]MCM0648253.1 hypothetical protein [Clostridium swellfunianum]
MYNDDFREYDYLDEIDNQDEFNEFDENNELDEFIEPDEIRNEFADEDEFVEFIPPYSCPYYRQLFPGGGFTPPRPPFGPPGGGPGQPFGPPGGPQGGPPSGPPPSFTPSQAQAKTLGAGPGGVSTYAVDAGSLRPCRFRFVYIWLRNGNSFWAWLTFVGRRSVSGYRWNGRRWVYFGIDTRRIVAFVCY